MLGNCIGEWKIYHPTVFRTKELQKQWLILILFFFFFKCFDAGFEDKKTTTLFGTAAPRGVLEKPVEDSLEDERRLFWNRLDPEGTRFAPEPLPPIRAPDQRHVKK